MTMSVALHDYTNYRRARGEKFTTGAKVLESFVRHVGPNTDVAKIDKDMTHSYVYRQGANNVTLGLFDRHSILKGFFRWLIAREEIQNLPLELELPNRPARRLAHIYTDAELNAIFTACMKYQKDKNVIAPKCIQFILKLTYVLGLRINETLSIKLEEIDGRNATIRIVGTKFYKSRLVTYNNAVAKLIESILSWRKQMRMPNGPKAQLFLDCKNRRIRRAAVDEAFVRIRKAAGLDQIMETGRRPRIHDLRHTFAVNRLVTWYRSGKEVQKLLPALSTYLGHSDISHTSVYLRMTPALLSEANKKFAHYFKKGDCL